MGSPTHHGPSKRSKTNKTICQLSRQFPVEESVHCRFGDPIVDGARAAVQWWASWVEHGETVTFAGTTLLRFAPDGLVEDHVDNWVQTEGRYPPYEGWGS